jgi:hypothetical protein
MTGMPTRRALLLAGLSAAALGGSSLPGASTEALTLDQFRALSARLMQMAAADLEPGTAETLLDGLTQAGRGPALAALVRDPASDHATAEELITAWYSGVYDTGHGEAVATFTDALVWNALDFTKPFASCGGETGYWAEPPQG